MLKSDGSNASLEFDCGKALEGGMYEVNNGQSKLTTMHILWSSPSIM